jgi:hypothetical protein
LPSWGVRASAAAGSTASVHTIGRHASGRVRRSVAEKPNVLAVRLWWRRVLFAYEVS